MAICHILSILNALTDSCVIRLLQVLFTMF